MGLELGVADIDYIVLALVNVSDFIGLAMP